MEKNEKGDTIIPASQRPDGTWRKEIVVKEGYVPQDEVRSFQTRFSSTRPKGYIPGMPPKTEVFAQPKSNSKGKDAKGEQKPDSSSSRTVAPKSTVEQVHIEKLSISNEGKPAPTSNNELGDNTILDKEKKIKGLKKKLRDIEELTKKDRTQLNAEQLEKLNKRETLERELKELEESK